MAFDILTAGRIINVSRQTVERCSTHEGRHTVRGFKV